MTAAATPQWQTLLDHVMAVPERIYESWNPVDGWDNDTPFGEQYGWNDVAWCVMFTWDMYADVGLAATVPKVAGVTSFTAWAQTHEQWSAYPSVGAWCNLGGTHTEMVVGFDADYVYTKGGNSIEAGSSDSGQGNGVWSHKTARRSTLVLGYFAPTFPDSVCPPTADPEDYRGGTAVTSYRWAKDTAAPGFPGRKYFVLGATSDYALQLQTWLQRGGWGPAYRVGPSRTMTALDLLKVQALQEHYLSALGPADGLTGPKTWKYAYEVASGLRKK